MIDKEILFKIMARYPDQVRDELLIGQSAIDEPKDILIVVHNQLEYLKQCIESIHKFTDNFTLYIWDNGSNDETRSYLESLDGICLTRSEENEGFIIPNNRLAAMGTSPYLILLNSDTEVREGWSSLLLGWLQNNNDVGIVSYQACKLDKNFRGGCISFGYDVDYASGWCLCMRRSLYEELGLFDEVNLKFAYCEDADLSLRVKEAGWKVYGLYTTLVTHYENKTAHDVLKKNRSLMQGNFAQNTEYLRQRWGEYLGNLHNRA